MGHPDLCLTCELGRNSDIRGFLGIRVTGRGGTTFNKAGVLDILRPNEQNPKPQRLLRTRKTLITGFGATPHS